ncbi:hypothetical protein GCM10010989_09690 [Croceicoccus pelagius]|uniref:DUF692 domain-containing protein n=1 Tax=Croceicoccus pelagius TaxID=1703341 RepID=A0A916YAE0_9SPHN|nr:hypothetical protein GCM10010989_09690 [Croceicoccus pelagius]
MTTIEPFCGYGLGLRQPHYRDFLNGDVPVDFVEVISENFMVDGGLPLDVLDAVRTSHEVVLHGVSLSPGSAHGLNTAYLDRLAALVDRVQPLWVSDHLCWTRSSAHNSHDLLPLPMTAEALDVVCANVQRTQDRLRRPILLENPSSYMTFPEDEFAEWDFFAEVFAAPVASSCSTSTTFSSAPTTTTSPLRAISIPCRWIVFARSTWRDTCRVKS